MIPTPALSPTESPPRPSRISGPNGLALTWAAIGVAAALVLSLGLGHEPLWLDETFSFAVVQRGFAGIIRATAEDVHPPLYYLLLKLTTLVLGSSDTVLRLPSVSAGVALVLLGAGPVRRIWGDRTAFVYAVLVIASPGIACFTQEARMYTLAATTVTASVLYGYLAVVDRRAADFIRFGVFALSAAYTHYFALLAVCIGAIALLALAASEYRRSVRPLAIAIVAAALGYLPWLLTVAAQVAKVSRGFWVPAPTPLLVAQALVAPFSYKSEHLMFPWQAMAALLVSVALIVHAGFTLGRRGERRARTGMLLLLATHALTFSFVLMFSVRVQPILLPRYFIPCSGIFLLAVAVGIDALPGAPLKIAATATLTLLALPALVAIHRQTFNGPFRELARIVEADEGSGAMLVHTDIQTLYPSWHVLPRTDHVILSPPTEPASHAGVGVYGSARLRGTNDLDAILSAHRPVWLVDMPSARYRVKAEQILAHDGWHRTAAEVSLDLPMSWVKARLSRFEYGR